MSRPTDVEARLRELLNERAQLLQPQVDTQGQLRALVRRFPSERRRSMTTLVTAAAAALALIAGLSFAGAEIAGSSRRSADFAGPALPPAAPTIPSSALPSGALATVHYGFVTPAPSFAVGNVAWINDLYESAVTRVDTRTLRVLGTVTYGRQGSPYNGTMVRAGNVVLLPFSVGGVGSAGDIVRFDAATGRQLAPIKVAAAGPVVVTPEGVFALVGPDRVGEIDAEHGRVLRTFALPVDQALAYADGLLWGWDKSTQTLVGVDVSRGQVARRHRLVGFTDVPFMSVGAHQLLLAAPGGVALVDPRTGAVTARTRFTTVNWASDGTGLLWGVQGGFNLVAVTENTLTMRRNFRVNDWSLVAVMGGRLFAGDRGARLHAADLQQLLG